MRAPPSQHQFQNLFKITHHFSKYRAQKCYKQMFLIITILEYSSATDMKTKFSEVFPNTRSFGLSHRGTPTQYRLSQNF